MVLGGAGDAALLGAVTLETFGLMLNPLSRDLLPMRLMLASSPPSRHRPRRSARLSGAAGRADGTPARTAAEVAGRGEGVLAA